MGRVRSLRSRATKDCIEDLRLRTMSAYGYGYISRRRMELLLAITDAFEREAFIPGRDAIREINEEASQEGETLTKQARRAMMGVLAGTHNLPRRKRGQVR